MISSINQILVENISYLPYLGFSLLVIAGFNVPISEDILLISCAILASSYKSLINPYILYLALYLGAYLGFLSLMLCLVSQPFFAYEPLVVSLPYHEKGIFWVKEAKAYEYSFSLEPGQTLSIELKTTCLLSARLWELGSNKRVKRLHAWPLQDELVCPTDRRHFILELRGTHDKIPFELQIQGKPTLLFPVKDKTQEDIISFVGDSRDEGIRLHEGLDIKAPEKTPLLAVKDGLVSDVGTRKRGGKFVMLKDEEYGLHYYYAHLYSYKVKEGQRVKKGDGLHVGHPLGYTASDIWGRFKAMQGYHVLHPMGFDSFGLPAETYAIQTGIHPQITTEKNIANFRRQIESLGFAYDWSREIQTHKSEYYKWTQWIFLQLFKKGLAYEALIPVWYCPALGTVLANEEVLQLAEGPRSERGGHPVERRALRQWMLRITAYAERLLEDLEELDWPESLKTMQRNWIGASHGALVRFNIKGKPKVFIEIYTTRPDTLYGATYLVLAPEHPLVLELTSAEHRKEVEDYIKASSLKSEIARTELNKSKSGVFTGAYALHPLNQEPLEIWVADYVLGSYGCGAVMGVPAHDERDFAFAKRYHLAIKWVVKPPKEEGPIKKDEAYTGEGLSCNSGDLNDLPSQTMKEAVLKKLQEVGMGEPKTNYRLRDWIFSRQRYWGEPIPIIKTQDGKTKAVREEDLPILLPQTSAYEPSASGESPLAKIKDWLNTVDPQTGLPAQRESNTMPQWAGSCWYYLRYLDPHNDKELASQKAIDYWMPVDLYIGGAEHAVLHLLYARFWHKVLYDLGLVKDKEPFRKLVNQGMITAYAFAREDGSLVPNDQVDEVEGQWREKSTGNLLKRIVAKMSKSLKNVVRPDDLIKQYGADSLRIYEMFMGPLSDSKPWNTQGLIGVNRFLNKLWQLRKKVKPHAQASTSLLKSLHKAIAKVTQSTEKMEFNTAVSAFMILVNELSLEKVIPQKEWEKLILLLAPYAPHLCEELWQEQGHSHSLYKESYPKAEESYLKDTQKTLVVQINSKVRLKLNVEAGKSRKDLQDLVLSQAKIQELLKDKKIERIVIIPDKLVNIVSS
ncbi:UNVERIFIED_CONTAM: hypothetical protein PYX00_010852 [Menopon gallinae]|uniref:leucine--tRNA ligase n=1 Tax=Menopon gallinae TaxID=328185 RepID=A0AAW2H6E6_9NEOP